MTTLAETYSGIRSGIVAFVPKYPEFVSSEPSECPHLSLIFGTGFIVGDSLVATNRHVAELFNQFKKPNGDPYLPVNALFFTKTQGGMGACLLNVCNVMIVNSVEHTDVHYETSPPDLALVSVACTGLDKYALTCEAQRTTAGTEIATAGFPMGHTLLAPRGQLERFGPVLQRGIISAESPFIGVEPHEYLIDVMVQGGASGSPVFRVDDGHVVGVVCARLYEPMPGQLGEHAFTFPMATNFSSVVPSTLLARMIEMSRSSPEMVIPRVAPSIEQVLDSMPKTPVDQITYGRLAIPPIPDERD